MRQKYKQLITAENNRYKSETEITGFNFSFAALLGKRT